MKTYICIVALLLLTGCVSNSFRSVLEHKNVDLIKPKITIQTPWGMQILEADSLRTRLTNGVDWPLPPLTNSPVGPIPMHAPSSSGTITLPLELGVTVRSK